VDSVYLCCRCDRVTTAHVPRQRSHVAQKSTNIDFAVFMTICLLIDWHWHNIEAFRNRSWTRSCTSV